MSTLSDLFSAGPGISAASQAYQATKAGVGGATKQLTKAEQQAIATQQAAQANAIQSLMGGQQQAIGAYQAGMAPWETMGAEAAGFLPMYASALGVGDPSLAQGAFQASPGYQYTLGQGIEGLRRAEAGTGQAGQMSEDAMKFAQNLSDQDYMNWLNNLFRGVGISEDAARGIQQGYGQEGAAYLGTGRDVADVYGTTGRTISGLQSGLGEDLANLNMKEAQAQAQRAAQIYGAKQGAASNTLNALFGLGNMAANFIPGAGGGGSSFQAANPLAAYSYDPTWSDTSINYG